MKKILLIGLFLVIIGIVFANSFSLNYQPCSFADEISLTSYVVNSNEPVSRKGFFYNGDEAHCLTPPPMGMFYKGDN
jgi:hypothetical protein